MLPAAPDPSTPVDAARMVRGAQIAAKNRCASCHDDDYTGEKQVPRIAGQREDYLAKTLAEFKAGARVGYTSAMNETLAGIEGAEMRELGYYLANIRGGP